MLTEGTRRRMAVPASHAAQRCTMWRACSRPDALAKTKMPSTLRTPRSRRTAKASCTTERASCGLLWASWPVSPGVSHRWMMYLTPPCIVSTVYCSTSAVPSRYPLSTGAKSRSPRTQDVAGLNNTGSAHGNAHSRTCIYTEVGTWDVAAHFAISLNVLFVHHPCVAGGCASAPCSSSHQTQPLSCSLVCRLQLVAACEAGKWKMDDFAESGCHFSLTQ